MASSLAVEDSANLDLNAGEQEGATCVVEAEPSSASDLDRGADDVVVGLGHRSSAHQEAADASSEAGASEESNMEVIDARWETRAGAEAVDQSGDSSAIEEVGVGVTDGSGEKVDKDDGKVPHEVNPSDSAGKGIDVQEDACSPLVHEALGSCVIEAETVSASGVAGSCPCDSAQQNAGDTPSDIQEAQAAIEEECRTVIVDELSKFGDQVGVKVVPSSSGCDNIAGNTYVGLDGGDQKITINEDDGAISETPEASDAQGLHNQQGTIEGKNLCSCSDDTTAVDSADVGRSEGECLADAVVGMDTDVIVQCREAIRKDGESYISQGQIRPIDSMESQGTHMADVERQARHEKLGGDPALIQMKVKTVVKDISSIEENPCTENRIACHNPDNHLAVTDQSQGSSLFATVCHMMTEESETSLSLAAVENDSLGKAGTVVKTHVEVAEIGNEIELTVDAQSITEENCSSGNEVTNHDSVDEQFQAAACIRSSKDNNPSEGLVVGCIGSMDVKQEVLLLQMNQKESLMPTGEIEVGKQSVLVVGTNQKDLDIDNSICLKEISTHKDPVGSGPNLLNIDPSAEAHLCKTLDRGDKNISYKAGDSIGCPNTMSDALITTSESRDPLLADEDPSKSQDDTVPPAQSNIESKSSDICQTDSNLMDKEYFGMEGLNLSVEISVPTASELSEMQAVISQDIESADQINLLEDKLVNPGVIDMDGEHEPHTRSEKRTVKQRPECKENDQDACYYILPEQKHSFSVSDLVWGKVKSHPWWPGQIFDPSYASELALKHQRKDSFLVAYFGDKTFAWCDDSQLKPFEPYFSQMEKQSISDAFVNAIDDALEEVSRRTEMGMACFCCSNEATSSLACQKFENAGIQEGSNSCVVDKSHIVSCFHPDRLVNYARALAPMPFRGADRLDLAVAKAHLKAFYRSKGYFAHPCLLDSGGYNESETNIYQSAGENVGKGSTEHMISTPSDSKFRKNKSRGRGSHSSKQMTDSEMQKTSLELTDAEVACELANGSRTETDAEIGGKPVAVYTGKIRKAPDSDSSDSERRKRKKLDCLGDMETKLPSPTFSSSFKVGECIRRVASQLAGSPSILRTNVEASHKNASKVDSVFDVFVSDASHDTAMHSPNLKMADREDYSPDELLSQLCAAAVNPMMGYKSVGTQVTFFTDFRNFCVVSSTEQRLPEKSRRGRKRKVETRSITSSMLITDHMQDSYWSDLASCESPVNGLRCKEAVTGRSQRRKRKTSGQTSLSPSSVPVLQSAESRQVGSPNKKLSLIVERSIIRVEEKMVDECIPTALILNFNGLKPLPSETDLTRTFSRYGPLKEAATEIQKKKNCVKVVFKRHADAEIAFSNTGKYSIFGPSLLSYRLRCLPLTPYSSPDIELQESDAIPFEDVSFEILDTCETSYMSLDAKSEDKCNAVHIEDNLETLYNCSIAYTSDSKSEDKTDALPVADANFETSDSHQNAYASSDTKLQDKSYVVPMEVSSLEIMDSCQAAYASQDTCSQDKGDGVPMEDSNLETPDIFKGNASPVTKLQEKDDSVPSENRNLEIPDSCQAADVSQNIKSQNKNIAVPMEDGNVVTSDICQGNASTDIKSQEKNDRFPLEVGNIEIPESCQATSASQDTSSQDKNDAVPMEDINLETPDPCQGNASLDTKSLDKNDLVPLEDGNPEISDSFQAASASQDAKSQDKKAVPMEDSNLETPDTCHGNDSPDTKSQDTSDTVPMEDSNPEILNSHQIAYASPYSKSQDKNDAVPVDDENLETSNICQDSENKRNPVSFEDGNHAPENCQTALISPDTKSAKDVAVTFEDSSLGTPDDYQTACTPSQSRPHDKSDSVPTEDVNLETPDIACTSPDIKPEDEIDAIPFRCGSHETPEVCQITNTKSQEK